MTMKELPYAQAFRDVVRELIGKELSSLRPTSSFATVDTINTTAGTCNVIFPGDTVAVPVKMYAIQPTVGGGVGVGDVVQIEGESGKRYVTRVVKGKSFIVAGKVSVSAIGTTGASSNLYVDPATGLVSRSTSSLRYKENIESVDSLDASILALRVVTYESSNENDSNRYIGLVAEELANSQNEVLRYLVAYDSAGQPDSVNYDRVSMVLIPAIQRLINRYTNLSGRITSNFNNDTANATAITDLQTRAASLEENLTLAQAQVTTLEENLTLTQTQVTTLEENLTLAQAQVTTLEENLTLAQAAITDLQTRVTSLEENLTLALARITALETPTP